MTVFKCKMCGGQLDIKEGMTLCECRYCGSIQTVPRFDNDKGNKNTLFSRANRLRSAGEFDKAAGVYETLVSEYPEEAEAYWGILLCKYGIEYVDDPGTRKKVPTCHRSSFESIMEDPDFDMVMECSNPASRAVYREEAKAIEALRIAINAVSSKEPPYDIFICYKETDETGSRTIDSVIAQDVYTALVEKGYRVFFSRITLEDKLGQEYEPYIFAALNSARIMLVFGTDYEYFNAVWVKNEWNRFLSLIEKGEKKTLIPCYKGIDAYDMPKEFARLQAQDMGKVGAIQDLLRGIDKILGANSRNEAAEPVVVKENDLTKAGLIKRMFMFIADNDFTLAERYAEKVLDIDPENGEAYLAKALIDLQISNLGLLSDVTPFENNLNTKKALRYGSDTLRNDILGFIASFKTAEKMRQKAEEERKRQEEIAAQNAADKVAEAFLHLDRSIAIRPAPAMKIEVSSIRTEDEGSDPWSFGQAMKVLLSNPRVLEIVCEKNLKQVTKYKGFVKVMFGHYPQGLAPAQSAQAPQASNPAHSARTPQAPAQPSPAGGLDYIEWLVLKKEENKVLIVSKDALDFRMYSENQTEVTWENSSLRRWLNEVFISSAFGAEEARMIVNTDVAGDKTFPSSSASGSGVLDRIFLLSSVEANLYLNSYRARACQGTAYCANIARASRGAAYGRMQSGKNDDTFACQWWLRTPRAYVSSDGTVNYGGRSVFAGTNAVRPAMWIDLEA
ncbi:MAG: toll/interleukin-1 receptor domain-containing protein [Clostridiales bacterium]|nr:toll/interleukin-1 receptor domain-containing protein [Clostridiales bacterium]